MRRWLPGPHSPAWVAAETMASAVFSVFGLLFIARLIGPAEAGTGALAASVFLFLDVPLSALFGDSLLQRPVLDERHRSSALWTTLAAAALAGALMAVAAPWIAAGMGVPRLEPLIQALAPLLPVSAASGLMSALALRDRRYRLMALRVLVCQPLAVGTGIAVGLAGGGAWAMTAQQVVATLVVFLLLAPSLGWRPRAIFDRGAMRELWPVAGPQILAILVFHGRYRIFILGLGLLVSESVVAVTHIAFRLLDVALQVITGAALRLALPRLAALQRDRAAMAASFGDLAQLQAMIGLPVAAGLAIAAPQLVALLMGGAWGAAAEPARLVALAAIPAFLIGPVQELWLALGRTRVNLRMQLVAFVVPLALLAALRPTDPAGAALCWVGGALAVPPLQLLLTMRALGQGPLWLARRVLAPVLATLGMVVVAAWVARQVGGQPPVYGLLAIAASGAAVYLVAIGIALGGRLPKALQEA